VDDDLPRCTFVENRHPTKQGKNSAAHDDVSPPIFGERGLSPDEAGQERIDRTVLLRVPELHSGLGRHRRSVAG